MNIISKIALVLTIIGGINWGLIGFFDFDLVAAIFGGQDALFSKIIYSLVGISALICIGLLFVPTENESRERRSAYNTGQVSTEFGEEADFERQRRIQEERRKKKDNMS